MTPREKLDLLKSYRAAGGTGSYISLIKEAKQYGDGGTKPKPEDHPLYPQRTPSLGKESWIEGAVKTIKPITDKIISKLNPYNIGVDDYSSSKNFSSAYSSAKSDGKGEFMWNNKRYNTKYAGTPRQEVGAYGIKGEPVHPMDLNNPIQVNQYKEVVSKYFPGHIEAGIPFHSTLVGGVNKSSNGKNKSEFLPSNHIKDQVYVYGADNFDPTKANPGYNLLFNNCADATCDAFGIPKKGITTPKGTMSKIKDTFQTIDVKGRTYKDYFNEWRGDKKNILNKSEYWLGISNSPDIQDTQLGKNIVESIQKNLVREGYSLPKSKQKYENSYDGVYGEETSKALSDWKQSKKK